MSAHDAFNPFLAREEGDSFMYSTGITSEKFYSLQHIHGKNEIPHKSKSLLQLFVELLIEPMPLMIWVAAVIELFIGNYLDMAILLFILLCNASISFHETVKALNAVEKLKKSFVREEARVLRDGKWQNIPSVNLVPGDCIQLNLGDIIPADCRLNKGTIDCDESALTGESFPAHKCRGSKCFMGTTVQRGESIGTVEFIGVKTSMATTAQLAMGDERKSNLQERLVEIMIVLVCLSVTLCTIAFIYLTLQKEYVIETLSFVIILIVASIPLAVEIVTTTTLALGGRELTHSGAIVKRLGAIEEMAGISILCSDKTGTLTLNKMVLQKGGPVYHAGLTEQELLRYAAMATKWDEDTHKPDLVRKLDALDKLVLQNVHMNMFNRGDVQLHYMPFDPEWKRTAATMRDADGKVFQVTKGATAVVLKLIAETASASDCIETQKIIDCVKEHTAAYALRGVRTLAIAKRVCPEGSSVWSEEDQKSSVSEDQTKGGRWEMLGMLTFLDPPREDSWRTIDEARALGINIKMITGDQLLIAKETGKSLNMGGRMFDAQSLPSLITTTVLDKGKKVSVKSKPKDLSRMCGHLCLGADGFAHVLPEHKFLIVECLREMGYKVGMTGDGVNDAPALKVADVGIAVECATEAASAAADLQLTRPGLGAIINCLVVSRKIFARIQNFLMYRIAATLQLLFFFFLAVFMFRPADYPHPASDVPWPSYFHLPVMMLMLITVLNDGALIAIGYDNVIPSRTPCIWNLKALFCVGSTLAFVACISSLIFLSMLLSCWEPMSLFQKLGLGGLSYGQITTSIYLKVSISDFLTLLSARTGEHWFWQSAPAAPVALAALAALSLSTIIACFWPHSVPDHVDTQGLLLHPPRVLVLFVWGYCLVWWLIQDMAKVCVYRWLKINNFFDINNTGVVVLPESTMAYMQDAHGDMAEIGLLSELPKLQRP